MNNNTPIESHAERTINAPEIRNVLEIRQSVRLKPTATPSVLNLEHFQASGEIIIVTNFAHGQDCQKLWILGDGTTTVDNNSNIHTNTGAAKLLQANVTYIFTRFNDQWYEQSSNSGSSSSTPYTGPAFTGLQDGQLLSYRISDNSIISFPVGLVNTVLVSDGSLPQWSILTDASISSAATWNAKVGGSGTSQTIAKFTASGTIGNSLITEQSGFIGLNGLNVSPYIVSIGAGLTLTFPTVGGGTEGAMLGIFATLKAKQNNDYLIGVDHLEGFDTSGKTGIRVHRYRISPISIIGGDPDEHIGIQIDTMTHGTLLYAIRTGDNVSNFAGGIEIDTGRVIKINSLQVIKDRMTGWAVPTGTFARATYATFAGQTISAIPTQTEVQNIDNHVVILSQTLAAVIKDLYSTNGHGLFGA